MKSKKDELIEKAKRMKWHCAECGRRYTPDFKNMGVILSLKEIDEFCEDCNKKAMRS